MNELAVRTKEEIVNRISGLLGDRTDDEALGVLEDIADTMDVYADAEDWRKKYEDNDSEWRRKYRERFENGPKKDDETVDFVPVEVEVKEDKSIDEIIAERSEK